jgi:methionyl-tRNA synthetase
MGLVQNLKKKLNNWVDRTLAELCSAYIKQLAKQTSRKRDNSLSTESSPNRLTTERQSTTIVTSSPDTLEKIIMKLDSTDEIIAYTREWAINKIENAELCGDKIALYAEFEDWIEIDDVDNIEIISIEKEPENEDRI